MGSLYEIHISVAFTAPEDEIKWIWYCREQKIKTIRGINSSGTQPIHNMTAKYCSRETPEEAISYAKELEKTISAHFPVTRTKVEGMMMNTCFDTTCLTGDPSLYWEFHFKVAIGGLADYEKLLNWHATHEEKKSLGISISERGETQFPTITIRQYHGSRKDALEFKDKIVKSLKSIDFHIHDKLQAECSIYDTCPEVENGWIQFD